MASSKNEAIPDVPYTNPASLTTKDTTHLEDGSTFHRRRLHKEPPPDSQQHGSHITSPSHFPKHTTSIYMGSYSQSPRISKVSLGDSRTPQSSVPASPRMSMNQNYLHSLLQDLNSGLETYGVEELRDGFFDAAFFRPPKNNHDDLMKQAANSLPTSFRKKHPLSLKGFLPKQWRGINNIGMSLHSCPHCAFLFGKIGLASNFSYRG